MKMLGWLFRRGFPNSVGARRHPGEGWGGMALLLPVLFLLTEPKPVQAQQGNTGLFWQCAPPSSTNPQGGYCPASTTYPLPVTGDTVAVVGALAGTQRGTSIASATALTIPMGATEALIQAQGSNNSAGVCLYWQDDGTNPTASAGQQMAAGASMYYKVSSLPIKLIAATGATCTITVSYYE